jgi:YHS domain-containing protein
MTATILLYEETMKLLKQLTAATLSLSVLTGPFVALAGDQAADAKVKPYTLKTCIVSGDKLGEMGDPYVFKYEGREIKFCCKGCVKDFKKEPAKYIKKIEEAEAKAKK